MFVFLCLCCLCRSFNCVGARIDFQDCGRRMEMESFSTALGDFAEYCIAQTEH